MIKYLNDNQLIIGDAFIKQAGQEIFMRELERITQLNINTIYRELKILVDSNILDYTIRGKIKSYFLKSDIDVELFLLQVESYRTQVFLERNIELKNYLSELNTLTDFIIFGSYATFENNSDSDIDIVIFSKKSENIRKIFSKFNIEIQAHFITYEEFKQKNSDTLVREILKKHILFGQHKSFIKMWLNEKNGLVQKTV